MRIDTKDVDWLYVHRPMPHTGPLTWEHPEGKSTWIRNCQYTIMCYVEICTSKTNSPPAWSMLTHSTAEIQSRANSARKRRHPLLLLHHCGSWYHGKTPLGQNPGTASRSFAWTLGRWLHNTTTKNTFASNFRTNIFWRTKMSRFAL